MGSNNPLEVLIQSIIDVWRTGGRSLIAGITVLVVLVTAGWLLQKVQLVLRRKAVARDEVPRKRSRGSIAAFTDTTGGLLFACAVGLVFVIGAFTIASWVMNPKPDGTHVSHGRKTPPLRAAVADPCAPQFAVDGPNGMRVPSDACIQLLLAGRALDVPLPSGTPAQPEESHRRAEQARDRLEARYLDICTRRRMLEPPLAGRCADVLTRRMYSEWHTFLFGIFLIASAYGLVRVISLLRQRRAIRHH